MFWMEIYRIVRRRSIILAAGFVMLFLLAYFWMSTLGTEQVYENGKVLVREKAIARDKEIASAYEGILTAEKVQNILDTYGLPPSGDNDKRLPGDHYNYCNIRITNWFGDWDAKSGDRLCILKEDWRESEFLAGDTYFTYAGGWIDFREFFLMGFVLVCVVLAAALSPTYAEDYHLRTADIILPCVHGRGRIWGIRLAAGVCVSTLMYLTVCLEAVLLYGSVYGFGGLRLSISLAAPDTAWYPWWDNAPLGLAVLAMIGCSYFALLVHVALILAFSAGSRQSFTALIVSLLVFIIPCVLRLIFLDSLRPTRILRWFYRICCSLPLQFASMFLSSEFSGRLWLTVFALSAAVLALLYGKRKYCRHQV